MTFERDWRRIIIDPLIGLSQVPRLSAVSLRQVSSYGSGRSMLEGTLGELEYAVAELTGWATCPLQAKRIALDLHTTQDRQSCIANRHRPGDAKRF